MFNLSPKYLEHLTIKYSTHSEEFNVFTVPTQWFSIKDISDLTDEYCQRLEYAKLDEEFRFSVNTALDCFAEFNQKQNSLSYCENKALLIEKYNISRLFLDRRIPISLSPEIILQYKLLIFNTIPKDFLLCFGSLFVDFAFLKLNIYNPSTKSFVPFSPRGVREVFNLNIPYSMY